MKKILYIVTLALSSTLLMAGSTADTNNSLTISQIQAEYPALSSKGLTITSVSHVKAGIYNIGAEIKIKSGTKSLPIFIDQNSHSIFVGGATDAAGKPYKVSGFSDKKEQAESKVAKLMPVNMDIVKKGVTFSFGNPEGQDIYIVSDPECPWCKKLEIDYAEKLSKYNVHMILVGFHKDSAAMIQWLLRGENDTEKAKRYHRLASEDKSYRKDLNIGKNMSIYTRDIREKKSDSKFFKDGEFDNLANTLVKSNSAKDALRTNSTPTAFDKDGHKINLQTL
jgi:thiol:disulfide interchange protein DsbC